MSIPTEPIGSIPRPQSLLDAMAAAAAGASSPSALDEAYDAALRDTITRFEATGSPVISDGEQTKPSFATYPLHGIEALAPDGLFVVQTDNKNYWRDIRRFAPQVFEFEELTKPWPDAPQGRTRREIYARQHGLPIFRGQGRPKPAS